MNILNKLSHRMKDMLHMIKIYENKHLLHTHTLDN